MVSVETPEQIEGTAVAVDGNGAEPVITVLDVLWPFQADDGHKGTFLIMRIAGLERSTALRIVKRKYRSWQNWCATDPDFARIDAQLPALNQKYGGEARVVRTALLDISIIETGIHVFKKILNSQPVTSDMWSYAVKLAGLRIPMMGAEKQSGSPWERLANAVHNTMNQKELTMREVDVFGVEKTITARETVIQPSAEQRQLANDVVRKMMEQAAEQAGVS